MTRRLRLLLPLLGLALTPCASGADPAGVQPGQPTLPEHDLADANAEQVTAASLLASERFWPYRVAIARGPWQPRSGDGPLRTGALGVLIRVEPEGVARIDFGRHGVHDVPVAATDLLERANRIRTGAADKTAPNLVLAVGPRLVDPAGDAPRAFPLREVLRHRHFLLVFADPEAEDFAVLAASLEPLRAQPGLLTILFPESGGSDAGEGREWDASVRERLRATGWTVPFAYDAFVPSYAQGLLRPGTPRPALLLTSAEGRVLHAAHASPQRSAELAEALRAVVPAEGSVGSPPGS